MMFLAIYGIYCIVGLIQNVQGQEEESMTCKENSDCNEDRGYCHPKSKMCLCKNGASTYPACNGERGNDCQPECKDNQFCDLKTKICMCTLGGFTKNCNTKTCPPFRVLDGSKCECMYGKENGRCRKCRQDCGQLATCEKQGKNDYKCVCQFGGRAPRCKPEQPDNDGEWESWARWSKCSETCGRRSVKTRSRECKEIGTCQGDYDQEIPCDLGPCQARNPPVNCGWCEWSPWTGRCGSASRIRAPSCPPPRRGGAQCVGPPEEKRDGGFGPDIGLTKSQDFHRGRDWDRNVFDVTCPGGCFEVVKAVFDCGGRMPTEDEMRRVATLCNGKERCQFVPGPLFFGRNVRCGWNKYPATWVDWRCNGNNNQMIVNNNFQDPQPQPQPRPQPRPRPFLLPWWG